MMVMIKSVIEIIKNDLHRPLDVLAFSTVILALSVVMPFMYLGCYIKKLFDYIQGVKIGNTVINNG